MLKKTACCSVFMLLFFLTATAQAYDTGRSEKGYFGRLGAVESRGFMNVLGMPVELYRTPAVEAKNHRWLWPVTFAPRLITNVVTRTVSAAYDIAFYPFGLPFSDDLSPLTDYLGLPEYPWQMGDTDF